jgi:hypothetical protein
VYASVSTNPSQYLIKKLSVQQTALATVACAVNDLVRFTWDGSTNVTIDVSKDSGSTWTVLYNATGFATTNTRVQASCSTAADSTKAAVTAISCAGMA